MLQLKGITKNYVVAGNAVPALNGIDLNFKENEFVAVLGPSGCGKTTLLNIIGGLDRYTSGDLLIDGKSTHNFKDSEWDAYRNAAIGFVFQSYNLISHLTILDNVEMALRLSGVAPKERKERAINVLNEVGLNEHLYKRPNQLSGGQMQRVAIARALVNNPKILLADEPTGALDSKTSEQIMNLIQKISKDRLVIMVTHNSVIAEKYGDRIIKLLDGKVTEDSRPAENKEEKSAPKKLITKKIAMSYFTAISTSFKNLLTKKGRTIITSVAGSIGIIGIALVLSISAGMTKYVSSMQSDTLAGFPLTISSTMTSFARFTQDDSDDEYPEEQIIYSYDSTSSAVTHRNNIDEDYISFLSGLDSNLYNSISYTRSVGLNVLSKNELNAYTLVSTSYGFFDEIPNNPEFIQSQYDVLYGTYPSDYSKLALILDSQNRLSINLLTALGITIEDNYTFEDLVGKTFRVISNDSYYQNAGSYFVDGADYESMYNSSALTVEISCILRVKEDASSELLSSGIGYTTMLTDEVLFNAKSSQIVLAQIASPDENVLTGQAFNAQVTYQSVMRTLGGDSTPTGIQIYPVSFDAKELIKEYLDQYNILRAEEDDILYSDLAETISTTISGLINTITIILAAFAGISLIVSSIMIGIITYVSVVERTKEIGIMRSLGARKKDISRIFNAETILIGLTSGTLGVLLAMLLNIPVNIIIENLIDTANFSFLSVTSALSLILLSTALTLIAGLIPSKIAAKKDPVIALRTE